jgi:hypothetical protein
VATRCGLVLALALVAAPIFFWQGGVVEEEALGFVGNYWGERPVLQRIFDPRGYDFYQARELSYAVDFLDSQWLRFNLAHGRLWFIAPSVVLASLGLVALFWWIVPRALPGLDPAVAWLLLLLYLSNFAALSTTGILYRATKPLVVPVLLAVLLFALREYRQPRIRAGAAFTLLVLGGTAMSLLDRQGFFYLVCLAAVLAVAWMRTRRGRPLLLGAAAAAGVALLYDYVLGPWIIHTVNGYWPLMRFQRLRPTRLLDPRPWLEAVALLRDWAATLLGNLPAGLLVLVAIAGLVALFWSLRKSGGSRKGLAAFLVLAAAAQVAMVAVMVQRHQPVTWIDHHLWYYPLPFQILLIFGLLWGLERVAVARGGALPAAVPVLLLMLVVSSVAHWPELRQTMQTGPWFSDAIRRSDLLKKSLRTGTADQRLDADHRRFFFACLDRFPRLAARAGPHVREGDGVARSEIRDGRLFAWARQEAHVAAFAPTPGLYRLQGRLRLRPGETVSIFMGSRPPRLLGEVRRQASTDGAEPFSFSLRLAKGTADVTLLSRLPETAVRQNDQRLSVGFGLLLPFTLWLEGP